MKGFAWNAMPLDEKIRKQIVDRIAQTTVESMPVNDANEIYEDLRIWGEDFYELVEWIACEFGTDFSDMDCGKLVPGEGCGELGLKRAVLGRSPFESCKVGRLLEAVERGRWLPLK
jgi:hypothetical protein